MHAQNGSPQGWLKVSVVRGEHGSGALSLFTPKAKGSIFGTWATFQLIIMKNL